MTDRQQIAADGAARGFTCDLWTDPPGQQWDEVFTEFLAGQEAKLSPSTFAAPTTVP